MYVKEKMMVVKMTTWVSAFMYSQEGGRIMTSCLNSSNLLPMTSSDKADIFLYQTDDVSVTITTSVPASSLIQPTSSSLQHNICCTEACCGVRGITDCRQNNDASPGYKLIPTLRRKMLLPSSWKDI